MTKRNSAETRKKILQVAEELFAEKGYDASTVDEIAGKAKVNKALIYYYFRSKEEVLLELLNTFVDVVNDVLSGMVNESTFTESDPVMYKLLNHFLDFYEEKKNILKILLMESLKNSPHSSQIFRLVDDIFKAQTAKFKERGIDFGPRVDQLMITEFFTGIMPMINYVVYHDKWEAFFGLCKEELRAKFFEAYKSTHLEYHKNHPL